MTQRAERIRSIVSDVAGLLYYDRKEDEDLPVGAIEKAIIAREITVDEIVDAFAQALRTALKDVKPVERTQIGTVTTLVERRYPINPEDDITDPATVLGLVPPGTYPVYRDQGGGLTYWEHTEAVPEVFGVGSDDLGDGMVMLTREHRPTGDGPTTVRSRGFTPANFDDFRNDAMCQPGPAQRFIFDLEEQS